MGKETLKVIGIILGVIYIVLTLGIAVNNYIRYGESQITDRIDSVVKHIHFQNSQTWLQTIVRLLSK